MTEISHDLGHLLPMWSILPFIGMLLSIAICPIINPHWWERRMWQIVIFWSIVFLVPFGITFGINTLAHSLYEALLLDYLPFIILLLGLFTVSGGVVLKGTLVGCPKVNVVILLIGTLLASWVGTTGASMLLIRPIIRANKWRKNKTHIIVFFIFLVSNIGGCLTPLGDPPLFLGFLRGVPFFWTLKLFPLYILNTVILLMVFFALDSYHYKKEANTFVSSTDFEPLKVDGLSNLFFIAIIVAAVIFSRGVMQIAIITTATLLSFKTTKAYIRTENSFTFAPIKEVAVLFIGIFITMIPALALLKTNGSSLGLDSPHEYFWVTGIFSSFLDNAPTYVVFMTTAGTLGATDGLVTSAGIIAPKVLLAVSAGAVFMGASTYIGNAPNFMVRSIAQENNITMPSFFGYMAWSLCILIPVFLLDTLVFFV